MSLYYKMSESRQRLGGESGIKSLLPWRRQAQHGRPDFGDGRGAPGDLVLEIVTSKSSPLSILQNFLAWIPLAKQTTETGGGLFCPESALEVLSPDQELLLLACRERHLLCTGLLDQLLTLKALSRDSSSLSFWHQDRFHGTQFFHGLRCGGRGSDSFRMIEAYYIYCALHFCYWGFPGGSEVKASACNAGDLGSIPGSGRSPGEGNGKPLQYSCLENPMDGGAWWATVHGVAKSQTRLSNFTYFYYYYYISSTSDHQALESARGWGALVQRRERRGEGVSVWYREAWDHLDSWIAYHTQGKIST